MNDRSARIYFWAVGILILISLAMSLLYVWHCPWIPDDIAAGLVAGLWVTVVGGVTVGFAALIAGRLVPSRESFESRVGWLYTGYRTLSSESQRYLQEASLANAAIVTAGDIHIDVIEVRRLLDPDRVACRIHVRTRYRVKNAIKDRSARSPINIWIEPDDTGEEQLGAFDGLDIFDSDPNIVRPSFSEPGRPITRTDPYRLVKHLDLPPDGTITYEMRYWAWSICGVKWTFESAHFSENVDITLSNSSKESINVRASPDRRGENENPGIQPVASGRRVELMKKGVLKVGPDPVGFSFVLDAPQQPHLEL